jgi:hypothetical protein
LLPTTQSNKQNSEEYKNIIFVSVISKRIFVGLKNTLKTFCLTKNEVLQYSVAI